MSSVIAIVKSIVGQVYAMSPEGFQRLLVEGDRLFKGDQLQTSLEGMATLELTDGRTVDLGRDTQWSESNVVAAAATQPATQTPADDVAQLQKAIEAGVDPTQELEATAAGPSAGGAGGGGSAGGGHSSVMLEATAERIDPTIGFPTSTAPLATEALGEEDTTPLNGAAQADTTEPNGNLPEPDATNSAPQGQNASLSTDEDTPISGQLNATDPDGDALTFTAGDAPRNGTVVINPDGSYTYTPNTNFNGNDSFTAIVSDGKGGTSTITVTIGVNPVNDAPVAANDGPAAVTEDTPATGNVLDNDSDVDGDTLSVTQFTIGGSTYNAGQTATLTGVGSLVINANGSFTFTPAQNYTGPVPTATYTVTDGTTTDTAELSFANVTPVDDASVLAPDTGTAKEDAEATGNVLANDNDVDSSLTVASFTIAGVASSFAAGSSAVIADMGTLTIATDGHYSFTPAANWNGAVPQVTYTTNTGSSSTLDITITPINDAPVAEPDETNVDEGGTVTINLAGNDTDVDDGLDLGSLLITDGPSNGTITVNADGTVSYQHNGSETSGDSFTYTIKDKSGVTSEPVTVYISVNPVNDAPQTLATSATGDEDATGIPVSLSGSDLDGNVASFVIKSLPANGTLWLNGTQLTVGDSVPATGNAASVTFVPSANWNGETAFDYAAVDNLGLDDGSAATATLTVNPVNDAPQTLATSATGDEDATGIPVSLSGSDLDGNVASFVIKSLPANGTLWLNGTQLTVGDSVPATGNAASVTFVPSANWNGETAFDYAAVDNLGLDDGSAATATLTVNPVNDAPQTLATSATGDEDAAGIPVSLSGSDLDGSVAHFVIKSLPANGTLWLNGVQLAIGDSVPATGNAASVTFVPSANWNGETAFDYAAVDNLGLDDGSAATATLTVNPVNDAPQTLATSATGDEDAAGIPVSLSGSDLDGSVAHFVIKSLPANGTLWLNGVQLAIGDSVPATGNAASVTFVPSANWNGETAFDYAAVDNLGLDDGSAATATLTVNPVNDAPQTLATSATGDEDAAGIPVSLSGSDLDGSVAHFVIKSLPANGTLWLNGVQLAIGDSVPATGNAASVTFVPSANWNGETAFDYAAVDNLGLEDGSAATATLTVNPVNDAPQTLATSATGDEDAAGIPVSLSGSDLDGSVASFVIKSLPANGTLWLNGTQLTVGDSVPATGNAASVTFVPSANWNGETAFDYAAVDNLGLDDGSAATATLTVNPVNDAPQTLATSATGDEDAAGIPVSLSGSDLDGSVAHFVIKSLPANGTLWLNGVQLTVGDSVPATGNAASVTFVPSANWNGETAFDYAAVDNLGLDDGSAATATLTVNPVNDAPQTLATSATGDEDAAGIPVNLSGSDLDGSVAHFVIKSLPANGTLWLNGTQLTVGDSVPATGNAASVTFVPSANWNGETAFDYAAVDNLGLDDGSAATATLTVNPVNDAPQTLATSATGDEDAAGIPVSLSGSDLDGSVAHFVIKSLPANGTLWLNGTQLTVGDSVPATGNAASVTFVPSANWNGETAFDYAAVDNLGLDDGSAATATLTVNPVNDAPQTLATSATGDEDATGIPVSLSGSDLDGNVASFVIKSLPANGTLWLNGTQLTVGDSVPATGNAASVTFVPSANWNGETAFDYAAVDNLGLDDGSAATATLTVNPVNDAPQTLATSATGDEDAAGIPVSLSGSDLDGSVAHFVIKSLPANGTLWLNGVQLAIGDSVPATGNAASVTFVPSANWNGETAFDYAAVDNLGLDDGSAATATLTVNPVNDAPQTLATSATGDEDAAGIPVSLSGSDLDGSVAHFVIKSLPANGTLWLNGVQLAIGDSVPATGNAASVTFVPSANWNGETAFDYAAVDNLGLDDGSAATATLTVNPVNDAPQTLATSATGDEDAAGIPVSLSGSDLDGSVAHFVIKSLPANGTLWLNGVQLAIGDSVPATGNAASVTFVPSANWNGETAFDYAAVDNLGLEDGSAATATLTVNPVNDAPQTLATSATGDEDAAGIPVSLSGSDLDGSVASFVIKSLPANGTLWLNGTQLTVGDSVPATGNAASVTFVPSANWNGETAFDYAAVDNLGLDDGSAATATLTVNPVNDAPQTLATSATGDEDAAGIPVSLSGSDLDGSVAHFVIKSLPANGTLWLNGVQLTVGDSVPATGNAASVTFVPSANWNGETAFDYAAVDNLGLDDGSAATATLTVNPVNDAPQTLATSATGDEDAAGIPVNLSGSDLDGSVAHFVIKSLPANGTLWLNGTQLTVGDSVPATGNAASVTFVPSANWNGETAFDYAAVDNLGLDDGSAATATLTVNPVNDAPQTLATSATGDEDAAGIPVSLSGSDLDGSVAHFVIKSLPANGTLWLNGTQLTVGDSVPATGNAASVTFVPSANWNGETAFDYAAVDNLGLDDGSAATATLTVNPVNDAPQTLATSATGDEDSLIAISLSGSDMDGTIASFKITSMPQHGTFYSDAAGTIAITAASVIAAASNGATIYFRPDSNWNGTTTFQYAATDNSGLADATPATGTLTVAPVNDAPNIVDASVSMNENVPANTQVFDVNDSFSGNDRDVDGQAITYSITGGNGSSIFVINPTTGVISIAPGKTLDYETARQHVLTVTASDGTLIDTAQITVNVNNLPDTPPSVTGGSKLVSETGLRSTTDTDTSNLATGKVTITHDSVTTVTLVTPSGTTLKSGGTTVTWGLSTDGRTLTGSAGTDKVITVSIDDLGNYSVNLLKPIDHPDATSPDVLNLNVGVKVKDAYNNEGTGTLTVQIQDDVPTAAPGGITIDIPVSSINISGLEAGFVNPISTAGDTSGLTQSNTDTDSYIDKLNWGGSSGSGYTFVDNEAYRTSGPSLPDSDFKVGTFTHNNFPISGTSLRSVDLVVKLTVMIDGVPTVIEHTVHLNHTETPNNASNTQDPANDDIIRLDNTTLVKQFTVGDRTFEFEIKGFLDPRTGGVVTEIRTTENAASSFDLYAVVKSTDGLPLNSGDVSTVTTTGADGDVLVSGSDASVSWIGATQQADGSFTITNAFGTFTGWADGRYRFEVSREARDNFNADQIEKLKFNYVVTDGDGDKTSSDVTVTLNGEKVLPYAPVVEQAAQTAVLSKEVGTQATASLGIEVGRDTSGASVKITATDDSSLNGLPVKGNVLFGGVSESVTLTSGGVTLVYRSNADGSLDAVKQGTNEVVFKVSGNAANGSFSVQMVGTLDQATTTQNSSSSLTFSQSNGAAQATSNTTNFTVSLSGTNGTPYWNGSRLGIDSSSTSNNEEREINYRSNNEVVILTFAAIAGVLISSVALGTQSFSDSEQLQYRINGGQWQSYTSTSSSPNVNISSTSSINTVEIRAGNSDTDFSINSVNVGYTKSVTADAGSTTTLNLGATVTDGSGDKASTDFNVVIDPDTTLQGTTGNDSLMGSSQADTLQGGTGDDLLNGGQGNDTLYGGDGKDLLIGGKGNDILWGQGGADSFAWKSGDAGVAGSPAQDVVKDFKLSEGDKIDLSDLLQGENTSTIDNFLKLIVDTGTGHATLLVSKDGHLNDAGGTPASHADLSITLENAATQLSGSSISSLIAGADPTIKVDHS
ncbi:retention module-containing protein [Pseudomonas sp. TCU-HL1]|uniref:retention module-containing protein n=1 Tax=Pseudomonas sp. TCU-HL1 TaxID=1856685 RepID=UPI00083D0B7F|nr:retention module-containing protein [Pseudomonas sp. TCU-HL1]AOE86888.1 hypothetical protein THL1_4340 [Pseudomonas sp. TCU-HL1]